MIGFSYRALVASESPGTRGVKAEESSVTELIDVIRKRAASTNVEIKRITQSKFQVITKPSLQFRSALFETS